MIHLSGLVMRAANVSGRSSEVLPAVQLFPAGAGGST
jgi:hypothetical protein